MKKTIESRHTTERFSTWILTDGRPGMVNQCLGLTEALKARSKKIDIALSKPWAWMPPAITPKQLYILSKFSDRISPPWPDLIIGTGRKSVALAIAVKRLSQGKTFCVQIQNPGLAIKEFDLVIAPKHDQLSGTNVFSTLGSVNRVNKDTLNLAKKDFCNDLSKLPQPVVTVLLGGNNAVYQMNKKVAIDIADKLLHISETYEYGLAITTSPRTPTDIVEIINEKLKEKLVNNKAVLWKGDGRNPYLGYLAHADFIFATNDSVNMISEAAATGKPVYTIELDGGSKKFTRFHKAMNEAKITRPFKDIIEHWSYQIPNDTIKAASEIKLRTNIKNV